MFHGSMVAIITPMDEEGYLDKESLAKLIAMHLEAGTDAIVVLGTTGESPTISHEERHDIIKFVVHQVNGSIPVVAGTGTYNTAETIIYTREAMQLGVDGCLVVTPYYNKPTQEGLYQHFKSIAEAVPIPLILYNIPGRTACDMQAETVERLAHIPNIVGIKEATGKVERTKKILELCDNNIDVFSGEDELTFDMMLAGARGVISVTANIAPKMMHAMTDAIIHDNMVEAATLNEKLMPLHKTLFLESNPIPVKWALYKMGLIKSGIRLPLTPFSEIHQATLLAAMKSAQII